MELIWTWGIHFRLNKQAIKSVGSIQWALTRAWINECLVLFCSSYPKSTCMVAGECKEYDWEGETKCCLTNWRRPSRLPFSLGHSIRRPSDFNCSSPRTVLSDKSHDGFHVFPILITIVCRIDLVGLDARTWVNECLVLFCSSYPKSTCMVAGGCKEYDWERVTKCCRLTNWRRSSKLPFSLGHWPYDVRF